MYLNQIIDYLKKFDKDLIVSLGFKSYTRDFTLVELTPCENTTVQEMLDCCNRVVKESGLEFDAESYDCNYGFYLIEDNSLTFDKLIYTELSLLLLSYMLGQPLTIDNLKGL